ncbi:MAG: hypothetical protein IIV16_02330 [Alistipes sp.]|nr:hypothetical protein [Alistipes sp.]
MNRAFLCSAIEGLASERGYHFQINDDSYYPTTVCRYPAAFMSQPEFASMEGRKHGRITYKVALRLAQQGAKLSATERNNLINSMEQELIEIFVELSKTERVAVVDELSIATTTEAIDSHGALAIKATALVETIF